MKIFLWLLVVVLVPGGVVFLGKWLKSIREYSYPDIAEDDLPDLGRGGAT